MQLHKAWLERRSGQNRYRNTPIGNETEARITYLRKLIKFKNSGQPMLSENDVSYVPHFEVSNEEANLASAKPNLLTEQLQKSNLSTVANLATTIKESVPNYAASTEQAVAFTTTLSKSLEDETLKRDGITTLEATTLSTDISTESTRADEIIVKSVFTSWSNWTPCSRSCGGGVKSQIRKCIKRT